MTDDVKRIEVDIGAAAEMLKASPDLCAMMNEMVGGPALVEAQAEIERLQSDNQEIMRINNSLRESLLHIKTVCEDNAGPTVRHDLALKFILEIVGNAVK